MEASAERAGNRSSKHRVLDSRTIHDSTFRIFASWLYFEDNPCDKTHECQISPNLGRLLHCYEASLILAQSKVEEVQRADNTCDVRNDQLSEMLRVQSHRFRKCLIEAVVYHCQGREDVPALEEISRVYSITAGGDPLRKLMADVYIMKGKHSVTDIAHAEFQRGLNASLLERMTRMQKHVDRVQGIIEPYKAVMSAQQATDSMRRRKKDSYCGLSEAELKMRELIDVGNMQPFRVDAFQYDLSS